MPELPVWATDVLWPGARVAPRPIRGGARVLTMPDPAAPTQLAPRRLVSALALSHRTSDDRRPWRRFVDGAAVAGVLAADVARGRHGVTLAGGQGGALVDHLRAELALPIAGAVVLCGPPRANQKPVLELHDRFGRPLAFAKVAWNDLTRELLRRELDALGHLERAASGFVAPRVLGRGTFAAGEWLAISAIGVRRRTAVTADGVLRLARAIEDTGERSELPVRDAPYTRALVADAAALPASSTAAARLAERDADAVIALAGMHGDFVPWNVLTGRPCPAVWDWERYERAAPVGFDRMHRALQVAIQRDRLSLADGVARTADVLVELVPELGSGRSAAQFDWYLLQLLCRYEHDAQTNPTPKLIGRVGTLASALDDRWKACSCR